MSINYNQFEYADDKHKDIADVIENEESSESLSCEEDPEDFESIRHRYNSMGILS